MAFNGVTANGQAAPPKAAAAKPAVAAAAPANSVYTAAQADRGQTIFKQSCTGCHETTRFTGADFMTAWYGKPMHSLFEVMSTTMPEDNPGSLKPQQYADVLAYFLRLNKFPAGQVELKGSADAMKGIKIDKK
ncbi:MAG TPA: cytochrome c [Vicinamibacterales bacterium]|nr:cytochrome c [Vicinamibacterales bacterium]